MKKNWHRIINVIADDGYSCKLIERIKKVFGIEVQIIKRKEADKFKVLTKRYIGERTFAWLDTNRRNAKDYERLTETSQTMIYLALYK
jgi:putative transposase